MQLISFFRKILSFPKSQQRGLILLWIIMLIMAFVSLLFSPEYDFENTVPLRDNYPLKTKQWFYKQENIRKDSLFVFNPNTATKEQLLRLGIPEHTVSIILNYRNKGGNFIYKKDLKKIYTLKDELYDKLYDYISLPLNKVSVKKQADFAETVLLQKKETKTLNLNTVDTTELKLLPHIGSVRARQIVRYRKLLGGYINSDQLLEVYSIDEGVYEKVKKYFYSDSLNIIQKISINSCKAETLYKHPYIDYKTAKNIVKYRQIVGKISDITELAENNIIDSVTFCRVKYYLSAN